ASLRVRWNLPTSRILRYELEGMSSTSRLRYRRKPRSAHNAPQEAIAVPGFKPQRDGPTKGDGYVKQQTSDRTWSGRSARSYSSIGHASVRPEAATNARRQEHHS